MSHDRVKRGVSIMLLAGLLSLGMLRIFAQMEPAEDPNALPPTAEMPQTAVGPGGETYVRAPVQQAQIGDTGVIAVMSDRAAYAWSSQTNTWYTINLSGRPVDMILSLDTVAVLTTDRAYAWNEQTNEWIWTFISGEPIRVTGSNGHIGVITNREAYAWNRDTHAWYKTFISGNPLEVTGFDDYYYNSAPTSTDY